MDSLSDIRGAILPKPRVLISEKNFFPLQIRIYSQSFDLQAKGSSNFKQG